MSDTDKAELALILRNAETASRYARAAFDATQQIAADVGWRLSALEVRFSAMESRFTAMEVRLGAIDKRLGAIEQTLAAILAKLP